MACPSREETQLAQGKIPCRTFAEWLHPPGNLEVRRRRIAPFKKQNSLWEAASAVLSVMPVGSYTSALSLYKQIYHRPQPVPVPVFCPTSSHSRVPPRVNCEVLRHESRQSLCLRPSESSTQTDTSSRLDTTHSTVNRP